MVYYTQVPVRPDAVRDDWEAYKAWVATLSPGERAVWERYGNDDDGPWAQFVGKNPDGSPLIIGGRVVGLAWLETNPSPQQIQEQFEWWSGRNPGHNRDFFTNWKPHPVDRRHLMGRWYAYTTDPYFLKIGPFYHGHRPDKPWYPPPPHWIKRPPWGGAYDRGWTL